MDEKKNSKLISIKMILNLFRIWYKCRIISLESYFMCKKHSITETPQLKDFRYFGEI